MTVIPDVHSYILIRRMLTQDPTVAGLLTDGSLIKVFADWVKAGIEMPYVVMSMYAGGNDNDAISDAATPLVKVTAFSEDQAEADNIRQAVHIALHMQDPDNTDMPAGVEAYDCPREMYAYRDTYLRENHPIFEFGGIYEIKLAVCS